jgi:hypothetical protein
MTGGRFFPEENPHDTGAFLKFLLVQASLEAQLH